MADIPKLLNDLSNLEFLIQQTRDAENLALASDEIVSDAIQKRKHFQALVVDVRMKLRDCFNELTAENKDLIKENDILKGQVQYYLDMMASYEKSEPPSSSGRWGY